MQSSNMTQTIARIKQTGKHFEILVDMDKALAFKKNPKSSDFLEIDRIFTDAKKGFVASVSDLKSAFGTDDVTEISQKIVKSGEVMTNQEHREEEREKKIKQVVDFLTKNSVDPRTKMPHTPDRIKSALEQAHVNIKNIPIENQIQDIIHAISEESKKCNYEKRIHLHPCIVSKSREESCRNNEINGEHCDNNKTIAPTRYWL